MVVLIARFARSGHGAARFDGALRGCGGGSSAPARPVIGVSMAHFDDNWLTILRTAMVEHAATFPEIDLQFADAQGDVGRQLSQIQNFAAQDAAAIIVNAADTSATPGMTKIARDAGVPLVYVNRRPAEETLPAGVVFVGSEDLQAGTLEMEELARLMNYRGNVAIMVGELASNGAQLRTKAVENVVAKYPAHENRREAGRQFSARAWARSDEQLADRGHGDRRGRREQRRNGHRRHHGDSARQASRRERSSSEA